jgi:hypothetical protein
VVIVDVDDMIQNSNWKQDGYVAVVIITIAIVVVVAVL